MNICGVKIDNTSKFLALSVAFHAAAAGYCAATGEPLVASALAGNGLLHGFIGYMRLNR